jgi:pimeloyl-ACP methyl ester carboxylesterase
MSSVPPGGRYREIHQTPMTRERTVTTAISTHTLDAPGATIAYDVRGTLDAGTPLLIIGSPMGADGFAALAGLFPDRPVITYDPRGVGRSTRTDGAGELTPEDHAGDLARVVEAIGGGPVDVLASSGGAVNALAWVAQHGEQIRTLVAHEPPLATLLPDREALAAAVEDLRQTYQRDGRGPAMAQFIVLVMHDGKLPDGYEFPPVDPAQFGLPTADDGSRDDALLAQNIRTITGYHPDVEALRASPARIVVARGEASGQAMAARGADAMAALIGAELVTFPGSHGGFMDVPDAFGERLREVLVG